ncbi:MAG: AAA family ATPase [Anaerolineales bacterium]
MANKLLPSFEVHGFRAFEHLSLEKLGRVNLIVGKNNVGKSSLLEALWVYANQGTSAVLGSLLDARDESGQLSGLRMTDDDTENQISSVRYLFHGRKSPKLGTPKMEFGPVNRPSQRLSIKFVLLEDMEDEEGERKLREVEDTNNGVDTIPSLLIQSGKNSSYIRLNRSFSRNLRDKFPSSFQCVLLSANGLSITDIGKFWDNITLSPQENDVLNTLQIIEPDIERVNLIAGTSKALPLREREQRIPIIKVRSFDNPVPLKSLGEGMNRLFGIALALANAKNGMLLVDEIESGLHYTVHLEMWRFIFQAAKRLDVQVFATTHSWDCISAFQEAAQDNEDDGMLIRLENKKGKIIPTFFDEKELAIVAREQIEVR